MDETARHLRLLTKTIAAVNSTLDLEEVLSLVAREVADALGADACFVYLYDEQADELVLRATFGTRVEEMTGRPRMRPGEGITGTAAAAREPVMIAAQAHLDERFKTFPNLPEDEYESILAVPILARERLEGRAERPHARAARVHGRRDRPAGGDRAQVAQTIEHAKLYAQAQRRVVELEALSRISEAVSESLYLEESLEGIVAATVDALGATGAALVLEDGEVVWPEGRAGAHAVRVPLRWKGRQVGELVCDRDTPFTADDRALLASIASHAAVALEHGRAVMRGVLAQEIHHRVKNNLQTVASLLRLQARADDVDARKALEDSVNRILAIAAVHEVLDRAARRRCRARRAARPAAGDARPGARRLEGGRVVARAGRAGREPRDRARARLLGAAAERARARRRVGAGRARPPGRRRGAGDRRRRLGRGRRAGLRHRALDRARPGQDELGGTLALESNGGLRAEVVFPA